MTLRRIFSCPHSTGISQPDPALYVNNKKLLTTSDEQAFMVYSRNKIGQTLHLILIIFANRSVPSPLWGCQSQSYSPHFRRPRNIPEWGWRAKAEIARQFGHYDSNPTSMTGDSRTGLGGYIFGGYKFENTLGKPEFDLGAIYLSGDNPNWYRTTKRLGSSLFEKPLLEWVIYIYSH